MAHSDWPKYWIASAAGAPFEVYEVTDNPVVAEAALKAHPGGRLGTGMHDGKLPKVRPPKNGKVPKPPK